MGKSRSLDAGGFGILLVAVWTFLSWPPSSLSKMLGILYSLAPLPATATQGIDVVASEKLLKI